MTGYRFLRSSGRFFVASPMISKFLTTASCVRRSARNCSNESPVAYSSILPIASLISSRRWSDVLRIHDLPEDIRFEALLDRALHHEIDPATKQVFEIELAVHIVVEGLLPLPKRHQHIHIAVRPLLSAYE